ncbi:cytochrome P450 [Egicoccus sp. AB-alg2]|uniref:cytochrome P450 n=1 Tax=Egicoccus sp. AB-alg2 TaxID=3242693 RepID=UPI00359F0FC2
MVMPADAGPSELDPLAPEDLTSAHEEFARLRQTCPVAHSDAFGGFWAMLRHDDVVAALTAPETYITSVQNVVPKVAFTGRRPPLHLDPPEHTPYRQVINRFFTPEQVRRFEPTVQRIAAELLAPYVAAGGGDLCDAFTHRYPGHVFAEFFRLPVDLGLQIREVTARYNRALQEARDELVKSTSIELYEIAREIIRMRTEQPLPIDEDLTSALLAKEWQGEPLPSDLVLGTIRQMIVVGMIAPSVFIGTMFAHLAQHPELQQQLREDRALLPAAIEEYLRLFTPYRGFARTATRQVTVRGRTIEPGEPIALVYASANRDEDVFDDPDMFVLNRPNIDRHIAFGLGPHRCAGESLARLMLQTALEELLTTTRSIELDGEVTMTRWPEWGTLGVPLRVEPA